MGEEGLTTRQETILALVIKEYISTAQPVGSKVLAERLGLSISPATIRNEMAFLEQYGYLTHPHTSAGRMPTEKGYRYFVERLMEESELSPAEQRMILHQFHQARLDLDQWARLAAAVLANAARCAALVTAPRPVNVMLKRLELVLLHDFVILLVLVTRDGTVKQQIITTFQSWTQDQLNYVTNKLNSILAGLRSEEIQSRLAMFAPFEAQVAEIAAEILRRLSLRSSGEIYRDGLINILRQPEFLEISSARQVVRVLEEKSLLESLLGEILGAGGVHVIIGGEGRWEALHDMSLVLTSYGAADYVTGAMGVLGPMRMPYARAISVVRYVSRLMNDLVYELYGIDTDSL